MFFSNAVAADPATTSSIAANTPTAVSGAIPMLLIVVVFYFLIIRPNQKKIKEHDDLVKSLRRGDKVVTAGGVIGTISKVEDDNIIVVEIADEVKIRVMKDTISNVLTKAIANDNKVDTKADKSGSK